MYGVEKCTLNVHCELQLKTTHRKNAIAIAVVIVENPSSQSLEEAEINLLNNGLKFAVALSHPMTWLHM